jgi:MoxR-like ATPase
VSTKPRSIGDVLQEFSQHRQVMQQELQKIIVGQHDVIEQLFAAIFTRGHCLLEGVPGLAKTLMVSTLARLLDVSFKRVQFTPDLMPSDITGTNVLEEDDAGRREFRFVEGPVFTNILLADEINRTPPKTQAALLQAMQEREVTVGRSTYPLPDPYFTIATQNPIEQEGTYPLPEAQLDRFMFNIKVDYPTADEEERILAVTTRNEKLEIRKVLSAKAILNAQRLVSSVAVSEYIIKYVARLVRATRPKDVSAPEFVREMVDWGAGPRAGQFLINGGKSLAAMEGRFSVAIEDVRKIAVPVLRHRLSTNFQAQAEGLTTEDIILKLLKEIPEPEIPKFATAAATKAPPPPPAPTSAPTPPPLPRSEGSRKNNVNDRSWDGLAIRPVFSGRIANPSYRNLTKLFSREPRSCLAPCAFVPDLGVDVGAGT